VPEPYQHLHKSYVENGGTVPVITGAEMLMAYNAIPGRENVGKVEWFPVSGGTTALKDFPRTYIIHTDKEACRDDGRVLEAALRDADVPVKLEVLPALPHYFWCFGLKNAGHRFRSAFVEGVKWALKAS
jgi:acetyl esterase/lipase